MMKARKVNQLKKRIIRRVQKSIYYELLISILLFLVIAFGIFMLGMFLCMKNDWLTQRHRSTSKARVEASYDLFEVSDKLYKFQGTDNFEEVVEEELSKLDGEVYFTSQDGEVLYSNIQDESLFTEQKINLATWKERVLHQEDSDYFYAICPIAMESGFKYILQYKFLEGEYIYTDELVYLTNGGIAVVIFLILTFLAVRKKIKYIEYLKDSTEEVAKGNLSYEIDIQGYDELALVAQGMNQMKTVLSNKIDTERREAKVSKELITNMSHDLKTPITIIQGYLDIVISKQYRSEEDRNNYIMVAFQKTTELQGMVTNLLQLAKSGDTSQSLNYSEVNVSRLLKQLFIEYEQLAEEKGISMKTTIPEKDILLSLDIHKITSVLNNLMENALKYCTEKGSIEIRLIIEKGTILISFINSANYLSEEDLIRIFDKFYRADKARNSSLPGNGIGLAVAKNIVEMHDGRIWAEYLEGKFILYIRLRQ
jgi:signal transduction histidine kinase